MRVPLNGLIGFALGTLIFGLVFWYLHIMLPHFWL